MQLEKKPSSAIAGEEFFLAWSSNKKIRYLIAGGGVLYWFQRFMFFALAPSFISFLLSSNVIRHHFRDRMLSSILKRAGFDFLQNYNFLKTPLLESSPNIGSSSRFYQRTNAVRSKKYVNFTEKCCIFDKKNRNEAEEALLDYLYRTRSFSYIHAEYMSTNSPNFLQKLFKEVQIEKMNDERVDSIARYLRYHPINEFELFFESIGLKSNEFIHILPRNMIYLADDYLLLHNYSVLCNYGIPPYRIGHIYMEATAVFSYIGGVLESKLKTFQDMGLSRSSICKFITSTPIILIEDGNVVRFMKEVNILGIKNRFIDAQLKNGESYNLARIVGILCFILKLCRNQNNVRELFLLHPDFMFEESGNKTFSLIGFLLKGGLTMQGILSLFLQFPNIKVGKFLHNMRRCYDFLKFLNMEDEAIDGIIQSHTVMLGSCSLKEARCICDSIGLYKSKIRMMVNEDPKIMMKWVLGLKIERLSPSEKNKQGSSVAEVEGALFDYLHSTGSLSFIHVEYMSKISPIFLQKLLQEFQTGPMNDEIGKSITCYLCDHPINEFEPFFESGGLRPSEFAPILSRNVIYLTEDNMLLENYSVLRNYGIPRNKIAAIYMEATEVFGYGNGILESKLRAFEDMGLHRSAVSKFVSSTPIILIDDRSLVKFVKEMDILGIKNLLTEAHLKNEESYNLTQIVGVLCFISQLCGNKKYVKNLFLQHPDFLFVDSGNATFCVIGFLLKCGLTRQAILSVLLQFPDIKIDKFMQNMGKCYVFLKNIRLDDGNIERIVRSHTVMLGSCSLMAAKSLRSLSGYGICRVRKMVKEDPEVMMKWVVRSKIERVPWLEENKQKMAEFSLRLGILEDSSEMKKFRKYCHCNFCELEGRIGVFLKAGWDRKMVLDMLRKHPKVLNLRGEVIQRKLDVVIGDFGVPVSSVMMSPWCLSFGIPRLKLRLAMYGWLKNQGALCGVSAKKILVKGKLKLSSILCLSEAAFYNNYVDRVVGGPDAWEAFKKQINK